MKNNNLLKKVINNKILDDVYLGREDMLIEIRSEVKEKLLKENIDLNKRYDEFIKTLKELELGEQKNEVVVYKFNQYFEEKNYKDGVINEEYYKRGLKDGINIVINALCSE